MRVQPINRLSLRCASRDAANKGHVHRFRACQIALVHILVFTINLMPHAIDLILQRIGKGRYNFKILFEDITHVGCIG